MRRVLILRPEPGASETAARAEALGLEPVAAPLFTVLPVRWEPPAEDFGAVLLTSANAARHAGEGLARFLRLPCFAVGEATAEAARAAGFAEVETGPGDGAAALRAMAQGGAGRALHLCGRDHIPLSHPGVRVDRRIVYAAEAAAELPEAAREALPEALVLLHSPRAAALFSSLAPERGRTGIAAISAAAAEAAGSGWRSVHAAAEPRDQALLELAAELCQTERPGETQRDR